jgi:hypothetical protein
VKVSSEVEEPHIDPEIAQNSGAEACPSVWLDTTMMIDYTGFEFLPRWRQGRSQTRLMLTLPRPPEHDVECQRIALTGIFLHLKAQRKVFTSA